MSEGSILKIGNLRVRLGNFSYKNRTVDCIHTKLNTVVLTDI